MSDAANQAARTGLTPLQVLRTFRPHRGTLTDFFASRAERAPHKVYAQCEEQAWSWSAFDIEAAQWAGFFHGKGVVAGDRVMIAARNSAQHVLLLLACARIGALLVPTNPQLKNEEAAYLVKHCRPRLVFVSDETRDVLRAVVGEAGSPADVIDLGEKPDLANMAIPAPIADPAAPCIIIYTSGTTGFPKGVVHSQASLIAAGEAFVERMHLQTTERMLVVLPMFHINAMFYSVAGSMAAGATLLIEPRFSASTFWQRAVQLKATQVNIIEAIATILLNRPRDEYVAGHALEKVYGARQAMVKPLREAFGIPMLIGGYAMTEIPGVLSTPVDGRLKPGTMGVVCRHPDPERPWAQCRVVDDADRDLPPNEVGELWVKTPVLMQGYYNEPEQTRASLHDGWFATGDLVRRDEEGFYFFVSRKKDIIRRRGENIAGMELDRVVGEHPAVLMAAAIGVPSEMGDEDIFVIAKAKEGMQVSEREIAEWCRARLSAIKVPRFVALVETMPLTPTHKVAKAALRADASLRARAVEIPAP